MRMGVSRELPQFDLEVSGSHLKSRESEPGCETTPINRGRRRAIVRTLSVAAVATPSFPQRGPSHRVPWQNIVILGLLMTLGAPVIPGLPLVALTDPFRIAVTAVLAV